MGDMLDLCHYFAQEDMRWHLDSNLWAYGAAKNPAQGDAMGDSSLGLLMSGLVCKAGQGQSQILENVIVSKGAQKHVTDAWPAVGMPVRQGGLSFDARSRVCRHVPRQAEHLRQSMARSAPAPGLIIAGHEYLERSILTKQAGCKALAMPPQQAFHLVRNRLLNPATSPPAAALSNKHGRGQILHGKGRASTAPATSCARTASWRLCAQVDGIGAIAGRPLPMNATLEIPDPPQTSYEVKNRSVTDPDWEKSATTDGRLHGKVRCYNCTRTTLFDTWLLSPVHPTVSKVQANVSLGSSLVLQAVNFHSHPHAVSTFRL